MGGLGGLGGMGGMGGLGGLGLDPAMMQQMFSNPMFQQMLQNVKKLISHLLLIS